MIPWVHLDTAPVPNGGSLRLMRRGTEFSIMLGDNELMNSRLSGSEEALAELGCADAIAREAPHVLIGGLGMGFTLRAALSILPPGARVTVAELVPAVERWARGPVADIFAGSLDDGRVRVAIDDVLNVMREGGPFDAVLLDVDNGPDGLTSESNATLYDAHGLGIALRSLKPRGVLAVWSAHPSPRFAQRLRQGGFAVEEARVRARRGGRGAKHVVWVARRPG